MSSEAKDPICVGVTEYALPDAYVGEAAGSVGSAGVGCIEASCVAPGVDLHDLGLAIADGA